MTTREEIARIIGKHLVIAKDKRAYQSQTGYVIEGIYEAADALLALSPPGPTEGQIADLRAALKPFADFAEKAEAFVAARAKDGGSPIMPSSDFRLADFKRAAAALRAMPLQDHGWRDIDTAPKDGTMIILWVEAIDKEDSCHPTENAMAWRTIGFNNLEHDGDDIWKFSGWCWQHDHFVEGDGTPTKWMPMPPPAAPAMVAEEQTSEAQ